MLAATS
ncbi:hypothetical protein YPPY66_3785, partial [Yersinia pestis PY-66]